MALRLLQTNVSQKIESLRFYSCPSSKTLPRVFIIIPQADGNCPFIPNSVFWNFFSLAEREGEKITELKKALVTGFDKLHYLCNLYIFGLYFVVQKFSFKHGEVWRFFNLTNKTFTKR